MVGRFAKQLVDTLEGHLLDLGERLALGELGMFPLRSRTRDPAWSVSFRGGTLADRFRVGDRSKVERAAHTELVRALDDGSEGIARRVLEDHDHACTAAAGRFCTGLDAAVHSVQVAAELARAARAAGPDLVARAHETIARWTTQLDAISARLTARITAHQP